MDITLLGTGTPIPDPHRAGPATLVRAGDCTLLVDAGRAVAMRLAEAGVFPIGLTAVLLTHLHSDHITDLSDGFGERVVVGNNPIRRMRVNEGGGPDDEYSWRGFLYLEYTTLWNPT